MRKEQPLICRRNHGFTVVEAMIAFVVLAVGLLALFSFHGTTQKSNAEAKVQAEAVALAEDKLQELESFLTETDARLNEGEGSDAPDGQLVTYTRTWQTNDHDSLPSLTVAEVRVSWQDRDGQNQEVVLSSAINRREPADNITRFLEVASHEVGNVGEEGGSWEGVPGVDGDPNEDETNEDDLPPNPEEENDPERSPQTITVSGTLRGSGTNLQKLEAIAASVSSDNLLTTSCDSDKSGFSCTLTYTNQAIGWTGSIVISSNKEIKRSTDSTCGSKSLSLDYSKGITTDQSLEIIQC